MGQHLKGIQYTQFFQQSYLLRVSAYKNGFYYHLYPLSNADRGRKQYTLSRRIILFSDIDMHIAATVTLLLFIYQHSRLFENMPCQLGLLV